MRVLSIDPGHTTGVAVFDGKGEYEFSLTVAYSAWNGGSFLTKLTALARPDIVVLEGLPSGKQDQKTAELFYELERYYRVAGYQLRVVMPFQWKGLTSRVAIPGQHARDAASMAQWWMGGQEYQQAKKGDS